MTTPHFQNYSGQSVLMVNDKPFIGLAAECHNSSASSSAYMSKIVWPRVCALNINTLLTPIYWEVVEPKKGQFDFSSVKDLILSAQSNHVKLVLLWFGLWKNGRSDYVPEWLKQNSSTQYAQQRSGKHLYSISPADRRTVDYDVKAFGKFMAYLKQIDADDSTVIMVQVENEVGLLTSDFNYSIDKESVLRTSLPTGLSEGRSETLLSQFGSQAGEYYMAWLYASAIERIAFEGKKHYSLPLYVNSWLEKPLGQPGTYPTGGPTARMLKFWKKVAVSIDLVAPDLYVPNFKEVCDEFSAPQSTLLIPETRQDLQTVSNLIYGISHYNLCLFSPFGAEDFFSKDVISDSRLLNAISIDADAFDWHQTGPVLAQTYSLLSGLVPLLVQKRQLPQMHSFRIAQPADRGRRVKLSNCEVIVHFSKQAENNSPSAGFILELTPEEFIFCGVNIRIELEALNQEKSIGLLKLEEGRMKDGEWHTGRVLNGDERVNIEINAIPKLLKIKTHVY